MLKYLFFGICFATIGIGLFAISSVPMVVDWSSAQSWEATDAYVQNTKLTSKRSSYISSNSKNRSKKTATYKVTANYTYHYFGNQYYGQRVSLSHDSDDIGSYHQDWHKRLQQHADNQTPITVWVNPEQPHESIIDRSLRWDLLLFQSLFLVIFGGVGIGSIIYGLKVNKKHKPLANSDPNKPWLRYQQWQSDTILSDTKSSNTLLLVIAVFWNLVSLMLTFAAITNIQKGEYMAFLVFIFPIIGVLLLYFWYRSHQNYKRIGPMPLTLTPYPASIGGQCGGTIKLMKPLSVFPHNTEVCLQCFTTRREDKKTYEDIIWEDTREAYWQTNAEGQHLVFYFEVDNNLPEADVPGTDQPTKWRLRLSATLPDGRCLDRHYDELPVFNTQQASTFSPLVDELSQSSKTEQQQASINSVLSISNTSSGYQLHFPAYRNHINLGGSLLGLILTVTGVLIPPTIFSIIFLFMGGVFLFACLRSYGLSLTINLGVEGITAKRTILDIECKPEFMPSYAFKKFVKQKGTGMTMLNKTVQYYSIEAHANDDTKIVVAKDIEGQGNAEAAIRKLNKLTQYSSS